MSWRSDTRHWGAVSKILHWLMALAIIGMCVVGWQMQGLPNGPEKLKIYALHKSIGITLLVLVLLRMLWRLADGRPKYPPGMPRWQRLASSAVHGSLYLVMIAMPISGWLYNSASNFPLRWFNVFTVPALAEPDAALKASAGATHAALFWVLAVLIVLHVGAALKHHWVERDDTLRRMLPGYRSRG
jgi:cytochrome b561